MRAGLVGTLLNYRPQEMRGVKYGLIDVLFTGDLNYPSEAKSIKVYNHATCAYLIQLLGECRDPVLTMCCWIDTTGREVEIILLDVLEVDRRELMPDGRDDGGADACALASLA
jgi:hypothetical protein